MFRNYLKIAWRNLKVNKLFTALNIAGLAIGVCVGIILFAYVYSQFTFDKYPDAKNIYRLNLQTGSLYNNEVWGCVPNAAGPAMKQNIAQVKYAARMLPSGFGMTASIKSGENIFKENRLFYCDPEIMKIFPRNFLEGNADKAFSEPNAAIISRATAKKYFGNIPAINRLLVINSRDTLQIKGVFEDYPEQSSIQCNIIGNINDTWAKELSWGNASFQTFCMLHDGSSPQMVEAALYAHAKNNSGGALFYTSFALQPLKEVHLYSENISYHFIGNSSGISYVRNIIFLALLVLLIACTNYMNLSTARSQKRAKDVGMNKMLGATFRQMSLRLYIETALLSLMALMLGYLLAFPGSYLFYRLTGNEIAINFLYRPEILAGVVGIWLFITLVAGTYPALYLAGTSPLILMNKNSGKTSISNFIRRFLVVFQFAASIVLIIAAAVIIKQMQFMQNKKLGYDPVGVVSFPVYFLQSQAADKMADDIRALPEVQQVSYMQGLPGMGVSSRGLRKDKNDKEGIQLKTCVTDANVVETLGIKLIAGKTLPDVLDKSDTTTYVLINKYAADYLGYKNPQDAVGKYIKANLTDKTQVVGVVENFNYASLRENMGAYLFYMGNEIMERRAYIAIRYHTDDIGTLLGKLQNIVKKDMPNIAFDYQFLDQSIQTLYVREKQLATTTIVFSVLAIFIACLGLFGLAAFTAEQRTKEIGVRKVLGASVYNIVRMLNIYFLKLVLLAFVIALPIAVWLMYKWLQGFAYKIELPWIVFVLAGIIVFFIALLTVSFQTIRAARANPVKSLKTE